MSVRSGSVLPAACRVLLDLAVKNRAGLAPLPFCDDVRMTQPARRRPQRRGAQSQRQLAEAIGAEVVRFQEESSAFDEVAARVLALERSDLPCMTLLLFGGPASVDELSAALHSPRGATLATVDRLQLAGYARRQPGGGRRIELTGHARQWIEHIWGPLRDEGGRLLSSYSARDLAVMRGFMTAARSFQEQQVLRLRTWLELPSSPARKTHLRGGLSPAALRRVQVFIEANLARPIQLADLAERAGLSRYHFARAFKASAGITPRAFVEQRRLERARQLITQSTQPLAQIAVDSGFGSQSRLTSTLKRKTGFTPGEHRRGIRSRRDAR
jgi:AraC family transcriptional regulator